MRLHYNLLDFIAGGKKTLSQETVKQVVVYNKNGTAKISNKFDSSLDFSIALYEENFYYPSDGLMYDVESEMINLFDLIKQHFFQDDKTYYEYQQFFSHPVYTAGFSPEIPVSKNEFIKYIESEKDKSPHLFRFMYLRDVEFILESIQSLVLEISHLFVSYYVNLSNVNPIKELNINENSVFAISNKDACRVFFDLSNYFVKLHSVMDLITKLAYELQCTDYDFTTYKDLHCKKKLYGNKKELKMIEFSGTLWEQTNFTQEIKSIRNEIIHNGSWQQPQNVYVKLKDGLIIERFVLYPDTEDGCYTKYKNRYHFFGEGKKVNDILPQINEEFFKCLINSLKAIANRENENQYFTKTNFL